MHTFIMKESLSAILWLTGGFFCTTVEFYGTDKLLHSQYLVVWSVHRRFLPFMGSIRKNMSCHHIYPLVGTCHYFLTYKLKLCELEKLFNIQTSSEYDCSFSWTFHTEVKARVKGLSAILNVFCRDLIIPISHRGVTVPPCRQDLM